MKQQQTLTLMAVLNNFESHSHWHICTQEIMMNVPKHDPHCDAPRLRILERSEGRLGLVHSAPRSSTAMPDSGLTEIKPKHDDMQW
jgi:hypothetical protein